LSSAYSVIHRVENGDYLLTGESESISDLIVLTSVCSESNLLDHAVSFELTEHLGENNTVDAAKETEKAVVISLLELVDQQEDGCLASVTCDAERVENRI